MGTFSGPLRQKAAYGPSNVNTFAVEANGTADIRGGLTLGGQLVLARKVVTASISAASSAASFTQVPRGYLEVYVSGVRCAIPYVTCK